MPIIRRTRPCTTACGVLHCLCWLRLCGAGMRAVCNVWKLLLDWFHTVQTARIPSPHNRSQHKQCRTPHAVVQGLVLLMMDIMMPETCWDRSLVINIRLVASCWFISLHPTFTMHGHKNLKCEIGSLHLICLRRCYNSTTIIAATTNITTIKIRRRRKIVVVVPDLTSSSHSSTRSTSACATYSSALMCWVFWWISIRIQSLKSEAHD